MQKQGRSIRTVAMVVGMLGAIGMTRTFTCPCVIGNLGSFAGWDLQAPRTLYQRPFPIYK